MNKKELFIPIIFIGLSIAFLVISGMVYLSNGKSKKWVARKFYIGGLLLSISTISSSCHQKKIFMYTCYMIAEDLTEDSIVYDFAISDMDTLSFDYADIEKNGNSINGNILEIMQNNLSFQVSDNLENSILNGRLVYDYNLNQNSGDFEILLEEKLIPGKYILKIFGCEIENQTNEKPIKVFHLDMNVEK